MMNSPTISNMQSQKPESLLTMLPPEVQKQVLLLIKRLGDQKLAKQQLQRKCMAHEQQIQQLNKQIEKLRRQNMTLKAKWESSFSMISKVRQNFTHSATGSNVNSNNSSSQPSSLQKSRQQQQPLQSKKTLKFNKQQNQWIEQSQEQGQHEQNETINRTLSPSIKVTEQYKIGQNYFSIAQTTPQQMLQTVPTHTVQVSQSLEKTNSIEMVHAMTAKKPPRQQSLQHSSSRSKLSNRSNKKQQIQQLKQQIQVLSEEIKSKQVGNMSLADKMRRCEEIKNRYKKGVNINPNSNNNSKMSVYNKDDKVDENRFINYNNDHIMGNPTYYSPMKYMDSQQQPIYHNSQSRKQNIIVNNNSNFQLGKKQQQPINITHSMQHIHNNSNNSPQQQQQQNSQTNSSFLNNTSAIYPNNKFSIFKQSNQSFYDDNLLDLIEQMNP